VKIPYSTRFISDHQIDAQEALIDIELMRMEMMLSPYSSGETFRMKEELGVIKRSIMEAREELHLVEVKRWTPWDWVKIKVYLWAVRGRFQ